MNENKNKIVSGGFMMIISCLVTGYLFAMALEKMQFVEMNSPISFIRNLFFIFVSFFVCSYIQIIIHESGHLIFGLLTGYKFKSFRIGSFLLLKQNGKLVVKKYKLAGTAGQCLMGPPDYSDNMPIVLYNLGGVIMNLVSAAVFYLLYLLLPEIKILSPLLVLLALLGVMFAAMNGIPLDMSLVANDGKNLKDALNDRRARKALWAQLKIVELQRDGLSLADMDESLFTVQGHENNLLVNTIRVMNGSRLLSMGQMDEAYKLMKSLTDGDAVVNNIHRQIMMNDCLYCELMTENNPNTVEHYYKSCAQLHKNMKDSPEVLRTQYTYALIHDKDREKAEQYKKKLDKVAETYPYPQDVAVERRLMEDAAGKADCL